MASGRPQVCKIANNFLSPQNRKKLIHRNFKILPAAIQKTVIFTTFSTSKLLGLFFGDSWHLLGYNPDEKPFGGICPLFDPGFDSTIWFYFTRKVRETKR